jgi:hypothetical protein
MDYALSGKDLRVKKDVSDLKLCPLFWGRVLRKKYFCAWYAAGRLPSQPVGPYCNI